jgi:hypothetical protein
MNELTLEQATPLGRHQAAPRVIPISGVVLLWAKIDLRFVTRAMVGKRGLSAAERAGAFGARQSGASPRAGR